MKYYLIVCFLAADLIACGASSKKGRIVGGNEAEPNSIPYQVSLQIRFFWIRSHICGGSIVNENWVVTAGHCVKQFLISWLPLDAIAGAHDVNNFGPDVQIMKISKRIPHPSYLGNIGPFDIALLKTEKPFQFNSKVQPVRLPSPDFRVENVHSEVVLSGWGALKSGVVLPEMPNKLQEVKVPLLSFEDCNKAINTLSGPLEISILDASSNICTGPLTGGVAACSGDSGGPLVEIPSYNNENEDYNDTNDYSESSEEPNDVIRSTTDTTENDEIDKSKVRKGTKSLDERPILLGVVSWGAWPCGNVGSPTVYTKVSAYLDFINSHIYE